MTSEKENEKEKTHLTTVNPTTGKTLQQYKKMTDNQAVQAVEACHQAFLDWRFVPLSARAEKIKAIGQQLQERKEELAKLITREMGKLLKQSREEIDLCTQICNYTAMEGPGRLADEERDLPNGGKGTITYQPIGVIYGIQPWNYPAYQLIRYSVANLMAGNGVLLKHAESVTGSALLLQEIYEAAGLPKDLFKVLLIDHGQSDAIIAHHRVRGVTLTGSPKAGKHIAQKAGEHLKKTVLELGSNDAYVVLEDADIEKAVKICVNGRIYNNGETCIAAKRFIVVDAVYDEFRDAFTERMRKVGYGDPMENEEKMGPMVRKDLREKLHKQVTDSLNNGAKALCGAEMPEGEGFYYPATVLENVKPGQPAYDDELFGPVASLIRAENEEDAMKKANDSRFGLGGAIFSKDEAKAKGLASKYFDTGMVFINAFGLATPVMPFGGVKDSGYGREHGGFGMREFVNIKSVMTGG